MLDNRRLQRRYTRKEALKVSAVVAATISTAPLTVVRADTLTPAAALTSTANVTDTTSITGAMGTPVAPVATSTPAVSPVPLPDLAIMALTRLTFGMRPGDVAAFNRLPGTTKHDKLQVYVDRQLHPDSIDDRQCDVLLARANLSTFHKSAQRAWQDNYVRISDKDPNGYKKRYAPVSEARRATFIRARHSNRQLYEVLVDFWHNHFNTNPDRDGNLQPTFMAYDRDVIRKHVLGNFREMLGAVSSSTEMLFYLDNASSSRGGPNENFARELFELHTLGVENYLGVGHQADVPGYSKGQPVGYVDDDVYEATRCFTGWRVNDNTYEVGVVNTGTFLYSPDWHDRFQKTVLGIFLPPDQPPLKDGNDVLNMLAAHPGTGRFIARKLARRLFADSPPESIVTTAAAVFTANLHAPDQLAQVVRSIALSDEFASVWGHKIKRPLELMMSMVRGVNAQIDPNDNFMYGYDGMGQRLFGHLTPNGFPDLQRFWSGTSTMLASWNIAHSIATNQFEPVSVNLLAQMPRSQVTANQIADYWINRILGQPMYSPASREAVVTAVAMGRMPDSSIPRTVLQQSVPNAVALILMSPDFRWR